MTSVEYGDEQRTTAFEVYVSKETFKFNAAHFVAFENYRERIHGHNYQVGVRLLGNRKIGADGYLIDFGNIKQVTKAVCKRLNERFLCPIHSNVLDISITDKSVNITCQDDSEFVFPRDDCALLPIVHATTEELAIYLYAEILNDLSADYLLKRGIHTMEVTVAEAPGQEAVFRFEIPAMSDGCNLDVRNFIVEGSVVPMPCLNDQGACCKCEASSKKSRKDTLVRLVRAINEGKLQPTNTITMEELENIVME
jgi:6-pyruvoyltetrahydropterin/6-carboxytetrahydropterin synthase